MPSRYVHGYEEAESRRLNDQGTTLEDLLHQGTAYPADCDVLEAGSGVGAQTVPLIRNSPGARLTCLDISWQSLAAAEARIRTAGLPLPTFRQGDLRRLPFQDATFDHAFVCFVLEHLADPAAALGELRRVLRPGGSLTIIEGDHGSILFHPDSTAAHDAIQCQVILQRTAGGDAEIGRCLYPLPGLRRCQPQRTGGRFIRQTFTTMVAGIRDQAIQAGIDGRCDLRPRHLGNAPHDGAGRGILLHLLQGDCRQSGAVLRALLPRPGSLLMFVGEGRYTCRRKSSA